MTKFIVSFDACYTLELRNEHDAEEVRVGSIGINDFENTNHFFPHDKDRGGTRLWLGRGCAARTSGP